jgi:2-dehydro-3-deoxyphosphogluconate aldolase/(4S)-4-hydroxy-2-oxoglutarate aldolase
MSIAMLPESYAFVKRAPVIPVMVIDDVAQAVPMARALVAGGLTALEVTLRTDCALESRVQISVPAPCVTPSN